MWWVGSEMIIWPVTRCSRQVSALDKTPLLCPGWHSPGFKPMQPHGGFPSDTGIACTRAAGGSLNTFNKNLKNTQGVPVG